MIRQTVMATLGINPVFSFKPTILVVHKEGRRRIENDLEIFDALRKRFGAEADVKYYDARNFPKEPITTRVRIAESFLCMQCDRVGCNIPVLLA